MIEQMDINLSVQRHVRNFLDFSTFHFACGAPRKGLPLSTSFASVVAVLYFFLLLVLVLPQYLLPIVFKCA